MAGFRDIGELASDKDFVDTEVCCSDPIGSAKMVTATLFLGYRY